MLISDSISLIIVSSADDPNNKFSVHVTIELWTADRTQPKLIGYHRVGNNIVLRPIGTTTQSSIDIEEFSIIVWALKIVATDLPFELTEAQENLIRDTAIAQSNKSYFTLDVTEN